MKRQILHSIFAAAALLAVAGSASAQVLKAEIPFAFRASNTLMQPGSYELVGIRTSNVVMYSLRNVDTHSAVLLSTYVLRDPAKDWVKAGTTRVAFSCSDNRCALSDLWTGGSSAYGFFAPKRGRGEMREIALSPSPSKAD